VSDIQREGDKWASTVGDLATALEPRIEEFKEQLCPYYHTRLLVQLADKVAFVYLTGLRDYSDNGHKISWNQRQAMLLATIRLLKAFDSEYKCRLVEVCLVRESAYSYCIHLPVNIHTFTSVCKRMFACAPCHLLTSISNIDCRSAASRVRSAEPSAAAFEAS
jgi:hypothetical protein